jgi:hypothetical protein
MLYVVNYKGRQVHSSAPLREVIGDWILFERGKANVTSFEYEGAVEFMSAGHPGYLPPSSAVGSEITVIDVSAGGTITTRTADGSVITSPDGRYSVNLGDPQGAQRGVQVGEGNIQINHF